MKDGYHEDYRGHGITLVGGSWRITLPDGSATVIESWRSPYRWVDAALEGGPDPAELEAQKEFLRFLRGESFIRIADESDMAAFMAALRRHDMALILSVGYLKVPDASMYGAALEAASFYATGVGIKAWDGKSLYAESVCGGVSFYPMREGGDRRLTDPGRLTADPEENEERQGDEDNE